MKTFYIIVSMIAVIGGMIFPPAKHSNINIVRATPTIERIQVITDTPTPECILPEYYNPAMARCRLLQDSYTEIPATETTINETEIEAVSTYETPGCGWYQPDYSTVTPPPTPVWSCP